MTGTGPMLGHPLGEDPLPRHRRLRKARRDGFIGACVVWAVIAVSIWGW